MRAKRSSQKRVLGFAHRPWSSVEPYASTRPDSTKNTLTAVGPQALMLRTTAGESRNVDAA